MANVVWREKPDVAKAKRMTHIQYALYPPRGGVHPMLNDLAKVAFKPQVEVLFAPETVFAQYKQDAVGNVSGVHLVNYVFLEPVSGVRLRLPAGKRPDFSAPFDDTPAGEPREVEPGVWELPPFTKYAFVTMDVGKSMSGTAR